MAKDRNDRFGAPPEALVFHIPGQPTVDGKELTEDVGRVKVPKKKVRPLSRSKKRRKRE